MSVAKTNPLMPTITDFNEDYWEGTAQQELRLSHCCNCNHLWLPPSPRCPNCLSENIDTRKASGRAKLWSWIVMHRQYLKDFPPPYIVAFVELEEGPSLMSTIVGTAADELTCDMPLQAIFEAVSPKAAILKFRIVQ